MRTFYPVLPALAFLLSSCIQTYFESPQPYGKTNEYVFPEKLRGVYSFAEKKDSVTVRISDSTARFAYRTHLKAALSDTIKLDSLLTVRGTWQKESEKNRGQQFSTAPLEWLLDDTLHLSREQGFMHTLGGKTSLRRLNDSVFFINTPHDTKPWWSVDALRFDHNGNLHLQFPVFDLRTVILLEAQYKQRGDSMPGRFGDTLQMYNKIAPNKNGPKSETHLINPTPAQLKQLYELKFFRTVLVLKKVQ